MAGLVRGFRNRWITPPQPVNESYQDRIVIVTGASSGLGSAVAEKFAALSASKVILAARDLKKAETAKNTIETRLGSKGQLEVWELDMNSYESIVAFTSKADTLDHLDVVILNAGIHRAEYGTTQHGWEEDLQVNTLSSTLLAILLLPKLKAPGHPSGKIPVLEFVNSGSHMYQSAAVGAEVKQQPIILEWYNKPEHFHAWTQYASTKLFQMHAMIKLASEVSSRDVIITSVCPGAVTTGIGRDYNARYPIISSILQYILGFLFFNKPEVGANTVLSGTAQGEMLHGRFWKYDTMMPLASTLQGDGNKKLGLRIWTEIIQILEKDNARVTEVLTALKISH